MFTLDLEHHIYKYDNTILTSATTLIKDYSALYDRDYWLKYKALQAVCPNVHFYRISPTSRSMTLLDFIIEKENVNLEDLDKAYKLIETEWGFKRQLGLDSGNDFDTKMKTRARRREKEPCLFTGTYYPVKEAISLNPTYYRSLIDYSNIEHGAYPDFMVYNLKYRIAGTLDWLYMNEDKTFYVLDLKQIQHYNRTSVEKMKYPLGKFVNNYTSHCKLQIWLYAYMLEQLGYTCLNTGILNYSKKGYNHYKYETNHPLITKWLDYHIGLKSDPEYLMAEMPDEL